jgi:hypothetical protein
MAANERNGTKAPSNGPAPWRPFVATFRVIEFRIDTLLRSIVFKTDFKYDGAQVTKSNIGRRERAVRPQRKRHRRSLRKGGNYLPINEGTRGSGRMKKQR